MPPPVIFLRHWKRKLWTNRQEYQPLEGPDYTVSQQPTIRIFLWCLFVVQLTVLTLCVFTLLERSHSSGNVIKKSNPNQENIIFVQADIYSESTDQEERTQNPDEGCVMSDNEKFDCHPESGGNRTSCKNRGCCWEPKLDKNLGVPRCFYPLNYGGYNLINYTKTDSMFQALFNRSFPSPYPDDVQIIRLVVQIQGENQMHIKIVDAESNRYEPPFPEIPVVPESSTEDPAYKFKFIGKELKIFRDDEETMLSSFFLGGFIFADQFLQISVKFLGRIYGLGEHQTSLALDTNWTKLTFFNRDGIPKPGANLYGTQPFFLTMDSRGRSSGVFFHNSNAMEVLLQPLPAITFRSIGGIFDFYIFLGPTPADVVRQYTDVVGRPFFPPYWSLGFHLSRLGYKNTSHIREVWQRTREAGIPFDTQWHDIDYMDKRNDFTYDKNAYADLPDFVNELHDEGMRYVPILDPGISGCEPKGTYPPYDEGMAMNVFVKNWTGGVFIGKVWNRKCTVFPDFTALNIITYWSRQIKRLYKSIPFDGLWIDMNEPSNFLNGSFHGCPETKWDNPPYMPDVEGGKLCTLTLCMSARHAAGLHYDLHNLYGISEAMATNRALKRLGKRPFIISRSTYAGIGAYAGHWSGDVFSTWQAMKGTIPKMLSFSLFGVPMMGADICGFNGNTTKMLCQRWSQLGAFYPFSRNHNSDDCIDQDPVALGKNVVRSARKALLVRYTLLPYLYTLFYRAHVFGETVARPLFFEFSDDPRTHTIDKSFLWGCCLLIVPVLKQFTTTVRTYLPEGRWYDWYTGLGLDSTGMDVVLHAPTTKIPVLIRGGVILPTQQPSVTTTLSRKNHIELIAAYNKSLDASGSFYWDDGESLGEPLTVKFGMENPFRAEISNSNTFKTGEYGEVFFSLTADDLTSNVEYWGYYEVPWLGSIKILGFVKPIDVIYFNDKKVSFNWNATTLVLTVKVKHAINVPFVMKWKQIKED